MDGINKWPVERYSRWLNKTWQETPLEKGNCVIFIKDYQLLLINKDTVLETVCLVGGAGFVKSSYSIDNLGILVQNQGSVSKFRVKFENSQTQSSINHCLSCVTELKKYIHVSDPVSSRATQPVEAQMKFKTIHEMALNLIQDEMSSGPMDTSPLFPEEFPLEDLIQQYILDPGLSVFVSKIEKTLKKISDKHRNKS